MAVKKSACLRSWRSREKEKRILDKKEHEEQEELEDHEKEEKL